MPDYRSAANQLAAQKNAQNDSEISALFQALIHGAQAKQQLAQHGEQAQSLENLKQENAGKFYQQATGTASGAEGLQKLFNSGASVHGPGGEGFGADPYAKMSAQSGSEASRAYGVAGKMFKPLGDMVNAHQKVLDDISQGTELGDKGAMVGLARVQEGQGQRLLQSIVQSMAGKTSSINSAQDAMNWLTNNPQSRLSGDQRNMIKSYVVSRVPAIKQQYQDAVGQAGAMVPSMAPHVPGAMDTVNQMHAPIGAGISRLDQFSQDYAKASPRAPAASMETPNKTSGIFDRLKGLIGGGTSQAPAQSQDPAYQRYLELKQKAGQ